MPNTTARRAAAYGVAASWETKRASVATVITAIFTAILSSFGMPSHHDVARQLLDIPLLPRATTAEELVAAVGIHAAYDQSLGPHVARFHQYLVENHLTTVAALSAIAQAANCWNFLMDQHPRLPRAVVLVIEALANPALPLHEPLYSTVASTVLSIINSLWSQDRRTGPGSPAVGGSRSGGDDHFGDRPHSGDALTDTTIMGSAINHCDSRLPIADRALCHHESSAVSSSVRKRRVGPSCHILKK